ncbi:MAG: universal stress protein [Desulfobacterales bacterium]
MFSKILVPVDIDYPDIAAQVYRKAAAIAQLSGAQIRLVTVMPGFSMPIVASLVPEEVQKKAVDHVKAVMAKFISDNCDATVTYSIRVGKNWEEIIDVAEKWGADLIIVYHNRHREINEVFSKSCSHRVADNAKCSVLWLRNVRSSN